VDAKGMLTNEQHELARTLYMQWLHKANNIVQLPTRESLSCKKQKMGGPLLFHGASLVEGLEGSPSARTQNDCFDPVTDEIEQWEPLSPDSCSEFVDYWSLLNNFTMMLTDVGVARALPVALHDLQGDCLPPIHEANVDQVFS